MFVALDVEVTRQAACLLSLKDDVGGLTFVGKTELFSFLIAGTDIIGINRWTNTDHRRWLWCSGVVQMTKVDGSKVRASALDILSRRATRAVLKPKFADTSRDPITTPINYFQP